MIVTAIAAMGANRVIGHAGGLPWDLPEDMQFFRDTTKGHIMIMGRKTFESFPGGKPLPGRMHIVITRNKDFKVPSEQPTWKPGTAIVVVASADEALREAKKHEAHYGEDVFVIGGGEIYKLMMPKTDRILLTEIHKTFDGDTKFPAWEQGEFKETQRSKRIDPKVSFDFVTYSRSTKV